MNTRSMISSHFTVFLIILILGNNAMAAFFAKKPDKEEFAKMLMQRPSSGTFRIDNINIKEFEFPFKAIELIHFTRNNWEEINAKERTFSNITFEDCKISDSNFTGMVLKSVKFKNCKLHNVVFNEIHFDKLIFEGCTITSNDPNIEKSYRKMKGLSIHFNQSKVSNVSMFESKAQLFFKNSELYDVSGYGMEEGSLLSIDNSKATQINFSDSNFSTLAVKNSHIRDSKANDATIGKVIFENSNLEFPVANGDLGVVSAYNSNNISIGYSRVKHVSISSCSESYAIHVGKMNFESITIDGCSASKLIIYNSIGKVVKITNSTFFVADLSDINIDKFTLENIRIRDKLNYKNAKVTHFNATNIIRDKDVELVSEGANFQIKLEE